MSDMSMSHKKKLSALTPALITSGIFRLKDPELWVPAKVNMVSGNLGHKHIKHIFDVLQTDFPSTP